jgi:hypothetical protein
MPNFTTLFNIGDYFKFSVPILESDTGYEVYKVQSIMIVSDGIKYTCERFSENSRYTAVRVFDEIQLSFDNIIPVSSTDFDETINNYLSIFAV